MKERKFDKIEINPLGVDSVSEGERSSVLEPALPNIFDFLAVEARMHNGGDAKKDEPEPPGRRGYPTTPREEDLERVREEAERAKREARRGQPHRGVNESDDE